MVICKRLWTSCCGCHLIPLDAWNPLLPLNSYIQVTKNCLHGKDHHLRLSPFQIHTPPPSSYKSPWDIDYVLKQHLYFTRFSLSHKFYLFMYDYNYRHQYLFSFRLLSLGSHFNKRVPSTSVLHGHLRSTCLWTFFTHSVHL